MRKQEVKKVVREGYAKIARQDESCCSSCGPCSGSPALSKDISRKIGYTEGELESVPEGANLGLGCGNPVAIASLKEGEAVLDLGSGAGFDCFLAANKVGKKGRVIGVDMTPEMIDRARQSVEKGKYRNVEFRLGEIENLPVADNSVDVIISNCVINLAPDKGRVFAEAFRALKPGGRLMVSDIVLLKELPGVVKKNVEAYIGCLSGAVKRDKYLAAIKAAGFRGVEVVDEASFPIELMANDATAQAIIKNLNISPRVLKKFANTAVSIKVAGFKPR